MEMTRIAAVLLAAVSCAPALAQPSITEVPLMPQPPSGYVQTSATAVSADGTVVTGWCGEGTSVGLAVNPRMIRWTASAGTESLSNSVYALGSAVSSDGWVIIGRGGSAFRWTQATGLQTLQPPSAWSSCDAFGCSGDGQVAVGSGYPSGNLHIPFRWTAGTGMQPLPAPVDGGDAYGASSDGSVVVGLVTTSVSPRTVNVAARWVNGGSPTLIPQSWLAYGVSPDGSVVVGEGTGTGLGHAAQWVFGLDNSLVSSRDLGVVPGAAADLRLSIARAVSADGRTVVGWSHRWALASPYPQSAFLWRPGLGMLDLNVYLPTLGFDLTGWDLAVGRGLSHDGRVIVGYGVHNGAPRGFVIRLPPWCGSADFNGDGDTGTDADIEAFFACLAGNCCPVCDSADFNGDGDVGTDADIESFFRVLAGGTC
jgi:probable HAF family extracellular repeat protein